MSVRLERALQIGMAMMSVLGTLMLGMGQRDSLLPVLATIVAISSIWLTDIKGWLRLNARLADLFGLAALVYSAWDFRTVASENQLLIVANLMVYLQFVLQYQEKSARTYWLLALLSLMQVAVSTALNLEMRYGALLVIYALVGMVTMALFLLYRESRRLQTVRERRAAPAAVVATRVAPGRWPLSQVTAGFAPRASQEGVDELDRGLLLTIGRLGALALLVAGVLFTFIPRLGRSEWRPEAFTAGISETGFNERVQLGSLGAIVENPAGLMRVRFRYLETREPYPVIGELFFRGVVLSQYQNGAWELPPTAETVRWTDPPHGNELVEQEILIEPLESEVVFSVYPVADIISRRDIEIDRANDRLLRRKEVQRSQLTYKIATEGLRNGYQTVCTPDYPHNLRDQMQMPRAERGQPDPLANLRDLAAGIVQPIDAQTPFARYQRAKALEAYFQSSTEFRYSLELKQVDPQLDPIEDFLLNTKQGHCEYFASALVLMLRSVGMPARMVVGYKGGDWNEMGQYLLVRQLHAHAWVECYLRGDQLPPQLAAEFGNAIGAWVRLDPTPGVAVGELVQSSGVYLPLLQQLTDYGQFLWAHYVMGMDARRQEEAIYLPLINLTSDVVAWLRDPETWSALYDAFVEFPAAVRQEFLLGNYFNWRLILVLILGLALLLLGTLVSRRSGRKLWRWWVRASGAPPEPQEAAVEFYHRLEQLLARRQLERAPGQTQSEFARAATADLDQAGFVAEAALAPRRVVDAFYRVRFGGRSLDRVEAEAVESALTQLERALAEPVAGHNGATVS